MAGASPFGPDTGGPPMGGPAPGPGGAPGGAPGGDPMQMLNQVAEGLMSALEALQGVMEAMGGGAPPGAGPGGPPAPGGPGGGPMMG